MADGPRYYRVSPKFWSKAERLGWDEETRMLALYILTCDHRTTEGLFRLPKQYICADLEWSAQRLAKPFQKLCDDGFIDYDDDAKVMLIVKALAYQSPSNPNGVTAALRALEMVPATRLDSLFYELSKRHSERLTEALPQRFTEPISHPPALSPAPALTPSNTPSADADLHGEEFEQFWSTYPRHHETKATGGGGIKSKALDRFIRLSQSDRAEVMEAVGPYAKLCAPNGQKPKHAERFLAGDAWKPYLPAARTVEHRARADICSDCGERLDGHDDQLCSILAKAG